MKTEKCTFQEYWGYYWRVTSRHQIPGIFKWDEDLINLIEKYCQPVPKASILDLGCGGGDQAKIFARRGYKVVGIDMVESLIEYAKKAFKKEGLEGEFQAADMREIKYKNEFDLCVLLSGTFGLLSERENEALLRKLYRALKPHGQAVLSYLAIERCSKLAHTRTWNKIKGGFALREEWFEVDTSTYHTKNMHILTDGKIIKAAKQEGYNADEIIRCYSARELELLAERSGFGIKAHLSNNSIGNTDYEPKMDEPRGLLILTKKE
jgi:2-polyprenyl-3-methyl-5-hydroxy-6-metoxy-1,4-benzoquinol methylase